MNLDLYGLFNKVFIWVSVISENLNGSWSFCFWNTCHNHSSHITAQYLRICHIFTIASLLYPSFNLTNASVAACSIYQRMAWRFRVLIILALILLKWWTEYNNWAVLIFLMRISPDRIGQWLTITVWIRFWIKFPHHYGSISSTWYKSSIVLQPTDSLDLFFVAIKLELDWTLSFVKFVNPNGFPIGASEKMTSMGKDDFAAFSNW